VTQQRDFKFDDLVGLLREATNNYNAGITRQSTSADVPGWDSLTHVVFILSLEEMTGVSLSPRATSELADLGALYDLVSQSQTSAG
jgi:acyl carrier protein